jgi:hypothetical protein
MNEEQFEDIAAAGDRLLRAPGTSLARLAIPSLHVLNEHPGWLAQYAPLFKEFRGEERLRPFKAAARSARGLLHTLAAKRAPPLPHRADVLIVSHLVHVDQLERDEDFYFGGLQERLAEQGLTSLLVLINHLNLSRVGRSRTPVAHPRFVLSRTVSSRIESDIRKQCQAASTSLKAEAALAPTSLEGRLAALAGRQALSGGTAVNLRMHAQLAQIFQALKPKMVITTYEGTEAERLVWHAARTVAPYPVCVGYQHALLLKHAHAIRRAVAAPGLKCDPEVVLSLGEVPHGELSAAPALKALRLILYGSHRRAALPPMPPAEQRPRQCLVLPDAHREECVVLFEFALACARIAPDVFFVLRPHPTVDTRALHRRLPGLRRLPRNACLSLSRPLDEEFSKTRYCLYRGSSAALHATRAGIKPFYVARPKEIPFDCLHGLDGWRETVTTAPEFIDRLRLSETIFDLAAAERARRYCEGYVSELRPEALKELLALL